VQGLFGYDQPCCRDGARPISVSESWEAMMFKRIDHVEIVTDQLDRTVQFYTEVLGFTVKA
jgi:catechol-2,3-dioxygenase